jgi:hypothetical protein
VRAADLDYDVLLLLGDDWDEVSDLEVILPQHPPPSSSIAFQAFARLAVRAPEGNCHHGSPHRLTCDV